MVKLDQDGVPDYMDTSGIDGPAADNDGDSLLNHLDPDDDNDQLSDTYELANQLDPRDAADVALDGDMDGLSNLAEANAGTDPNDGDSNPDEGGPGDDDPMEPDETGDEADPLQDELLEKFRIEVPVIPWPAPPKRLIRVSGQVYNRDGDYEELGRALRSLLA